MESRIQKTIMDLIEKDLDFVLDLMKSQIEQQKYKDYFISINRDIIDVFAFKSYIETTAITNFGRIKNFIEKADEINAIYNENLHAGAFLAQKEYEPIFINTTSRILSSNHPIECILIQEGRTPSYATPAGYESFFSSNPKHYTNYQLALKCLNLMTAIDKAFSSEFPMRYYRQKSSCNDPHTVEWNSDNSIKFGKDKVYFPFDCHPIARCIMQLRMLLLDRSLLITDLQSYPLLIFQDSNLKFHPNLAGWIYNILETWIKDLVKDFQKSNSDILIDFLSECKTLAIESKKNNESLNLPEIKPHLNVEIIMPFFEILKPFFNESQQIDLKMTLSTGRNVENHLLFMDNGNRLADAFKQLFESDLITGCQKKELENWISKNFTYRYRNEIKFFKARYLSDIISTTKNKCQNPVLNVRLNKQLGKYIISKA